MILKNKLLLLFILFLGLFLRLYGNNWDQGWHLHPDERFLTMVGNDVKLPESLSEYLSPATSSFNPVNKGHTFYVYGTFPILLNKALAVFLDADSYDLFHLQGRALSATADFLVILVLYKLIELVEIQLKLHRGIKYFAAFLYSIAVLPIQLSHFFAVDTFLNLFCWTSLYFAVKGAMLQNLPEQRTKNGEHVPRSTFQVLYNIFLSGLFFGLALACKVSAVYFAPLLGIVLLIGLLQVISSVPRATQNFLSFKFVLLFVFLFVFLLFSYLALRFGSPYYFETGNVFSIQISTIFLNSIKTLKSYDNPAVLFPPANQWISAPWYLSPLNLAVFGIGPVYFFMSCVGFILLLKKKNLTLILCMSYLVIFSVYQSLQFAKTMRYLILLYPALAFFAAVGLQTSFYKMRNYHTVLHSMFAVICCMTILTWPLAFMSIYTQDHSRVAASKWMYENMKAGSTIISEYWDDPLPLMVQDPTTRNYKGMEAHIFDPDTKEKWDLLNSQLSRADYYVMSSNRGWGSIPKTPQRYPIASGFYKRMFDGTAGYTLVQQFSSYPSLRYLGIPLDFPDQWAEEAFTVYDHPLVSLFKKTK